MFEQRVVDLEEGVQEFNGVKYYFCGRYFETYGQSERRLHRAVWRHFNGDIPDGYHIHHVDHDVFNNNIENLVCITMSEHMKHHALLQSAEHLAKFLKAGQDAARAWHGSEEGIEWHKKQYQLTKDVFHKKGIITCSYCEKEALVKIRTTASGLMFCSSKCKSAHRRASGVDDETRDCKHCKQSFMCNKYQKTLYCSTDCRRAARKTLK